MSSFIHIISAPRMIRGNPELYINRLRTCGYTDIIEFTAGVEGVRFIKKAADYFTEHDGKSIDNMEQLESYIHPILIDYLSTMTPLQGLRFLRGTDHFRHYMFYRAFIDCKQT